jgi:hydroxymethylglutaryl-CoA reductase (NADPH)
LSISPPAQAAIADWQTVAELERYHRNIENLVGSVKVPLGVVGPLRIDGRFARGGFYIPLATTEASLVASYNRGTRLLTEAGGCTAVLLQEGISRTPGFIFRNLAEVTAFVDWLPTQFAELKRVAESTTQHGKLLSVTTTVEGNHVYLAFQFTSGDAAGQNMITIATEAACLYIHAQSPVQPQASFVEANLSGDKKASARAFQSVRGRRVSAEAVLSAELVEKWLRTTPALMADYWRISAIGGVLSGTFGVQGHYANGLAALYIACGQDAACVAESAVGVTRFEVTSAGALYASVTLPNVLVGTVGGGTALPSQRACLEILRLAGPGSANAFAEVCAGLCLAGELSIVGALCAGEFTRAHLRLARNSQGPTEGAARA